MKNRYIYIYIYYTWRYIEAPRCGKENQTNANPKQKVMIGPQSKTQHAMTHKCNNI